jgi:uncharacterized membrane protein YkvA (DUF1232 family)
VHEERSESSAWRDNSGLPANDNDEARPRVRLEEVVPEDENRVRESFWSSFAAARPRFGRLSGLRDFAVNLVRLFEMLVEPGFAIPWRTTAAIVFALTYFISSIDLIPDTIPVLGFMDDAFVVAEVMVMVADDLARFEERRRQKRTDAAAAARPATNAAASPSTGADSRAA